MPRDKSKTGKSKRSGQKRLDNESKPIEDDWEIKGWINSTERGKVFTISDVDGNLIGYARASTMERLIDGEIKGCPIKTPIEDDEE